MILKLCAGVQNEIGPFIFNRVSETIFRYPVRDRGKANQTHEFFISFISWKWMLCSRANTSKVEYFFFSSNGGQYLADLGICFQVHADSVQDTLKFNLLRELYVHTYMTKRAFSYIWARTPNLRRIKVSYSTNLYSGRLLRPCQRDNGNYAPQRTHYAARGLHYAARGLP